jgi:hypothetical protein
MMMKMKNKMIKQPQDEVQDEVKLQDGDEEADGEPKEDNNPNPTTAKQQQLPADNVRVTRSRRIFKP